MNYEPATVHTCVQEGCTSGAYLIAPKALRYLVAILRRQINKQFAISDSIKLVFFESKRRLKYE